MSEENKKLILQSTGYVYAPGVVDSIKNEFNRPDMPCTRESQLKHIESFCALFPSLPAGVVFPLLRGELKTDVKEGNLGILDLVVFV